MMVCVPNRLMIFLFQTVFSATDEAVKLPLGRHHQNQPLILLSVWPLIDPVFGTSVPVGHIRAAGGLS